jgi:hypothetical protein
LGESGEVDWWDDIYTRLCSELGVDDNRDLNYDSRFQKWERGFLAAVQEFWNEVKDKL